MALFKRLYGILGYVTLDVGKRPASARSAFLIRAKSLWGNCGGSGGFTLIETMLAVSLFALVLASSYGIFRMGIQIWQRTLGPVAVERKAMIALETIAQDIRNTLNIRKEDSQFRGLIPEFGGNGRSFSLPMMVTVPGKEGSMMTQIGGVFYEWDPAGQKLCRRIESLTDWYKRKKPPCRILMAPVIRAEFRYWLYNKVGENYSWYDRWDFSDGLPQAVEIVFQIVLPSEKGQMDRKPSYRKTVLIPVGGKRDERVEKTSP